VRKGRKIRPAIHAALAKPPASGSRKRSVTIEKRSTRYATNT
jgi:hypothetical protein